MKAEKVVCIVAGALGAGVAAAAFAPASSAFDVETGRWVAWGVGGGDYVATFDNTNNYGTIGTCSFNSALQCVKNVDWPTNMIYWGNADKYKVFVTLANKGMGTVPDGSAWGYGVNAGGGDSAGAFWNSEQGSKKPSSFIGCYTGPHQRYYAQNGKEYMYNEELGKYVFATTHKDIEEGNAANQWLCGDKRFGWNEDAEDEVRGLLASNTGSGPISTVANYRWMQNGIYQGQYLSDGYHYAQSNGYASKAYLP